MLVTSADEKDGPGQVPGVASSRQAGRSGASLREGVLPVL